ncbi:MAG: hypothetical protein PHF86_04670 [Candidatus Nanoarchaeia archaeon]|nr:hypothetical protein [Candidatus Nanoarchaeia archaeon]
MDVLVVGLEFISFNFIQHLLDKYTDYNIICIDKIEKKYYTQFLQDYKKFYFYRIDNDKYSDVLSFFKFWYGFDFIINFISENNTKEEKILLEIIQKYKTKKYLQAISCSAYNNSSAIQQFLKIPVVSYRYSGIYGCFQHPDQFIPSMIINALEGNLIYRQNFCRHKLSNVIDYCRGLETLMHYGTVGETYFLEGTDVFDNDITLSIANYLGFIENIQENNYNDNKISLCHNNDKLNKQYGWKPVINIRDGLVDTIEWYKDNKSWWKSLKTLQELF